MKKTKRHNMKTIVLGFALVVLLVGCSSKKSTEEEYAGQSAQEIYDRAESSMDKGNYSTAVKNYEALQSLYPFGEHAEQAALDVIYSYYQNSDYISTSQAAENFIHVYPRSEYVDYAYYMRAVATMYQDRSIPQRYIEVDLSKRDLKSARQSFRYFGELLQFYPSTRYYQDARQRMIYLRNLFAKHEYDTAQFYFTRKAYLAAAERGQNILLHFQQSPYVADSLILSLESYNVLGLDHLSDNTWAILKSNYPDEAEKFVKQQQKKKKKED